MWQLSSELSCLSGRKAISAWCSPNYLPRKFPALLVARWGPSGESRQEQSRRYCNAKEVTHIYIYIYEYIYYCPMIQRKNTFTVLSRLAMKISPVGFHRPVPSRTYAPAVLFRFVPFRLVLSGSVRSRLPGTLYVLIFTIPSCLVRTIFACHTLQDCLVPFRLSVIVI